VPTKATLSLPLLNWTGEKKYDERLMGRDKDRERSLTNYRHGQKRLNLGKKKFNLSPVKSKWNNEKIKPNLKNTFLPTPPFFLGLTLLPIFYLLPLSSTGG